MNPYHTRAGRVTGQYREGHTHIFTRLHTNVRESTGAWSPHPSSQFIVENDTFRNWNAGLYAGGAKGGYAATYARTTAAYALGYTRDNTNRQIKIITDKRINAQM